MKKQKPIENMAKAVAESRISNDSIIDRAQNTISKSSKNSLNSSIGDPKKTLETLNAFQGANKQLDQLRSSKSKKLQNVTSSSDKSKIKMLEERATSFKATQKKANDLQKTADFYSKVSSKVQNPISRLSQLVGKSSGSGQDGNDGNDGSEGRIFLNSNHGNLNGIVGKDGKEGKKFKK